MEDCNTIELTRRRSGYGERWEEVNGLAALEGVKWVKVTDKEDFTQEDLNQHQDFSETD